MQDSSAISDRHDGLGVELYGALRGARTVTPLSAGHPGLTIDDAYAVSLAILARRRHNGE